MPGAVFSILSVDEASPKSVSFTSPENENRTFGGDTSRCTSLSFDSECAWCRPRHSSRGDVDRDVDGKGDPLLGAAVPHRAQILAVDVVHREVQLDAAEPAGHARVEHRHQVAVRQLDDDLGLVAEARDVLLVGEVRQHGLDDAQLLHAGFALAGEIERAHAALRQVGEEGVTPETPRESRGRHDRLSVAPSPVAVTHSDAARTTSTAARLGFRRR